MSSSPILTVCLLLFAVTYCKLPYCQPSDSTCWPSQSDIDIFSNSLDGALVLQNMSDSQYITLATTVQNNYRITYPAFITLIKSHSDVQNCVKFASDHNIQITIRSTGHSYSGRFSANNSLQINLSNMQKYNFNKNISPPTLTIETGIRYGTACALVNATMPDYVMIGAGDPSVAPAGHTSLGGHSPLTPQYGLSSDYVKEYYIVDANANILHIYNTSSVNQSIDHLYWAMKGGGASTWGVVLNITFNLIKIERKDSNDVYNWFSTYYSLYNEPWRKQQYIGYNVLYNYFDYIPLLDHKVSGYFQVFWDTEINTVGFAFNFNYFGNSSYAKEMFMPLTKFNPYTTSHNYTFKTTKYFYDQWVNSPPDTNDDYLYLWNDFIPQENLTYSYADTLLTFLNETQSFCESNILYLGGTATLIGGVNNLDNYPYGVNSAVGEGFRKGYFSFSLGVLWINESYSSNAILYGQKWENNFRPYGFGIYSNEENYECDNCDWKQEFFGTKNYNRLLDIKQQYDPNQVFWCSHCVGSDI